ncbi:MAG: hypothetical protein LRZ84_03245 [Desertifilum sp.]|nr:hypothetical protein [Desertifilum sp.]
MLHGSEKGCTSISAHIDYLVNMRASGNIRSEDRGLWRSPMGTNPISASFGQF